MFAFVCTRLGCVYMCDGGGWVLVCVVRVAKSIFNCQLVILGERITLIAQGFLHKWCCKFHIENLKCVKIQVYTTLYIKNKT